LLSNSVDFYEQEVNVLKLGKDCGWSSNLMTGLSLIPHQYIFLIMDDLFLKDTIDTKQIQSLVQLCVDNGWQYLRLNPTPGPPTAGIKDRVGKIPVGDWYRSSTVMSVWKKQVLLNTLVPGENAWDFEILGSRRTDKHEQWFASVKWNFPFHNLVIKGKIDPFQLKQLQTSNIRIDTERPVMGVISSAMMLANKGRSKLMHLVPRKLRRKIRERFSPR
jgi:hypothetical protein